MPWGSNAVEKNKAGTAFDNVLWEIANCYTSDMNRTVCSHWVLSTCKFIHLTHEPKKEWNSFEALNIEIFWKSLPVCVIWMYAIWLSYSNEVLSVWPSPGGLKLLCITWIKKKGKICYGIMSYEAIQSFCRSGFSGLVSFILGTAGVINVGSEAWVKQLQAAVLFLLFPVRD